MSDGSRNGLMTPDQASALIDSGAALSIAGDRELLLALPKGNWIGGTTPYFVASQGGLCSRDFVYVQCLHGVGASIRNYDGDHLPHVLEDAPEHGYSLIILPAGSRVLEDYARYAPTYFDMFIKPIAGWVSGVHVAELGQVSAAVVDGRTGDLFTDRAVVLHVQLPEHESVTVHTVNLFEAGDGPELEFAATGFSAEDCLIDGQPGNLADTLQASGTDRRGPLVADYCGALVNVSIQAVDAQERSVRFYAPVFEGVRYRFAKPVDNYPEAFLAAMPEDSGEVLFSCNCILNYLDSNLEGQRTGQLTGPITFGEVAYQLLNQTAVYLTLERD
ncbi:hypothetical protein EHN06_17705 [Marinobacter sp. NP-4(2019)]|uniref:DUF6976 family protein n=1 Tax=Marinobacter sp. NP-4(2019) TaxID=2488665 RepID=UPI000FC3D1BD|nr:hypothetical protein [Marinobacter sp. NP-4(2019)]AZT85239.1 hypothetical protein EHN06_17705 [Marinobacter sp. NP-4(2019)]